MKLTLVLILSVLLILLPGCEVFASPKVTNRATAEMTAKASQDLVDLVRAGTITPEQYQAMLRSLEASANAVNERAAETGYEFDWTKLVELGGTAIASITGVQIIRNRARKLRGEPVAATPAKT